MTITVDDLRKLLHYDPSTGSLTWLPRTADLFPSGNTGAGALCRGWNKRFAGKEALTSDFMGYRKGSIMGLEFYAHRVAYALHTGAWPSGHIDHLNGCKVDNRAANLRDVSQSLNRRNGAVAVGKSGHRGVRAKGGRWMAYGKLADRQVSLGTFDKLDDAISARRAWASENGFTERHEMARQRKDAQAAMAKMEAV